MDTGNDDRISARIELLETFLSRLGGWWRTPNRPFISDELTSYVNRNLRVVRSYVVEAGCLKVVTAAPAPVVGGLIQRNLDPFENIFERMPGGGSFVPYVLDSVEQSIGVYEHQLATGERLFDRRPEAIDAVEAISRTLRPAFRRGPPENEAEVQDAVETILHAIGVDYEREADRRPAGARNVIPDFTLAASATAIEIKLAKAAGTGGRRTSHGASHIQEEINADITAYRPHWKRLVFVVYDLGAIDDPHRFEQRNRDQFGVTLVVVKH